MPPAAFPFAAALARRLARHGLTTPVPAGQLAAQAGLMGGVHAQIITAAEISLGLRVAGATRAEVQAALWDTHSLIKTFGPRGTVHLLPAAELALWTGAFAAIPNQRPMRFKDEGLTPAQTEQIIAAIAEALSAAELTVDELTEALVARLGAWAGDKVMPAFQDMWPRWRWATDAAANAGALVFGPNRGRLVTYTNPRRWLPRFEPAPARQALAFVVERYLYAYGPATPPQLARWLNAPNAWTTDLFQSLAAAGVIEPVAFEGGQAWVAAGDTAAPAARPTGLYLLPYFDAYGVGSFPREKIFPGVAAQRALGHGQAGNFPVLLINGVVAGLWHQRRTGQKLALTVESFQPLSARHRRALDEQVERLGQIQHARPTLTLGPVTVGPHA